MTQKTLKMYGTAQRQLESRGQTTHARGLEFLPARAGACTGTHACHKLSATGNKYS